MLCEYSRLPASLFFLLLVLHLALILPVGSVSPNHDLFEFHIADLQLSTQGSVNLTSCCLPGTWIPPDLCFKQCRVLLEVLLLQFAEIPLESPNNYAAASDSKVENAFRTDVIFSNGKMSNTTLDFHINLQGKAKKPLYLHVSLLHQSPTDDVILLAKMTPISIKGRPKKIWTTHTLQSTIDTKLPIRVTLSYRFVCPPDYYGDDCERYCAPRDSLLGHYKCDPKDGRIICLSGWRGSQCTEAICKNGCLHGFCESPGVCRCLEGWTGEACDSCIPFPGCSHGTCKFNWSLGQPETFTCECQPGWSGSLCTIDNQYCSNHPDTCLNGGLCHNTITETSPGYACQCLLGYEGYHCEISNQDCRIHRCSGHGICQASGICACFDGYYGSNCQFNQTGCWQNPCQGEKSICKTLNMNPTSSLAINFRCECQPGLSGMNCENKIRQCDTRPCLHGGKCVELTDGHDGYQCVCLPGYQGRHCELSDSACQHLPCANGGVCVDRANHVECRCPSGWTGPTCRQNINECTTPVCKNGAACRDRPGTYECLCTPGWTGRDCNIPLILNSTSLPPSSTLAPPSSPTICLSACNGEDDTDRKVPWPHTSIVVRFAVIASIIVLICTLILTSLLLCLRKRKGWRYKKSGFEELQRNGPPLPKSNPIYWNASNIPEPLLICSPGNASMSRHKPAFGIGKTSEPSRKEGFSMDQSFFYDSAIPSAMVMASPPPNFIPICGPSVHHHAIVYTCQKSQPPPPYEELVQQSKCEGGIVKKGPQLS